MTSTRPTPAESFAIWLRGLLVAVAERSGRGRIAAPLVNLIWFRISAIGQRFARLAARIAAGTYRPRRPFKRRPALNPKPRQKSPLPEKFGWLVALMPTIPELRGSAPIYRYQLQHLFEDPEMQALLAAAPNEMGRILRPLCWMLQIKPPAILARPRRAAAPEPPAPAPASPEPAQSAPPERPSGQMPPAPPPDPPPAPPEAAPPCAIGPPRPA